MRQDWRDRAVIPLPQPARLVQARRVARSHRRGTLTTDHAIRRLRKIYPRLTMSDAAWRRFLDDDARRL